MTTPAARIALLLTPPVLLASTYAAFQVATGAFGDRLGYFVGFLFYWFDWCFLVSLLFAGPGGVKMVLASPWNPLGNPRWLGACALFLPWLLGFGYALTRVLPEASLLVALVLVAVVLGMLWGWVARNTGSLCWTIVSHVVFNFSGLGARLYFG